VNPNNQSHIRPDPNREEHSSMEFEELALPAEADIDSLTADIDAVLQMQVEEKKEEARRCGC
jgi:hypothetical protein